MAICPFAQYKPVTGHDGGKVVAHSGLVLHVQQGNGGLHDYFQNSVSPNRKSAHFWVAKSGTLEQYLDTDLQAWAQGNGNAAWASVETEGYPTEPLTAEQLQTLGQLYRWGHSVHGWPLHLSEVPQGAGFGWHGMGGESWGGHVGCPGDIRKAQRQQILTIAEGNNDHSVIGAPQTFGDDLQRTTVHIAPLDGDGNGWVDTHIKFENIVSVIPMGPSPDRDSYGWPNWYWSVNNTNDSTRVEIEGGTAGGSADIVVWATS